MAGDRPTEREGEERRGEEQEVRERDLKVRAGTRGSGGERCRGRAGETAGRTGRRQGKLSERNMAGCRENEVKKGKRLSKRDRSRRECSAL